MELVNETVARWRDWGYLYYIVDPHRLYRDSAWTLLPQGSYLYRARIESKIVCLVQVPIGSAATQFLLHHGDAVIKPLPSLLQR
jgi:hypothetical protein